METNKDFKSDKEIKTASGHQIKIKTDSQTEAEIKELMSYEQEAFGKMAFKESEIKKALTNEMYHLISISAEGSLLGYVFFRNISQESELYSICVNKSHRGRGYGKMLIGTYISFIRERNIEKVFLEVRKSNTSAIRLYEKSGFIMLSERKDYYEFPKDDALIMCYEVKNA